MKRAAVISAVIVACFSREILAAGLPEFKMPEEIWRAVTESSEKRAGTEGAKVVPVQYFGEIDVKEIVASKEQILFHLTHNITVEMKKDDQGKAREWIVTTGIIRPRRDVLPATLKYSVVIAGAEFSVGRHDFRGLLINKEGERYKRQLRLGNDSIALVRKPGRTDYGWIETRITPAGIIFVDKTYDGNRGVEATDRTGKKFTSPGTGNLSSETLLRMTKVEDIRDWCRCGELQSAGLFKY